MLLDFLGFQAFAFEMGWLLAGTWYLPPSCPAPAVPRPRSVAVEGPTRKSLSWMTFFMAHSVKGYLR